MRSVSLLKSKTTRELVAACEAVGLEFWSKHPAPGCVWAVADQRFHVVRINRRQQTAQHACTVWGDFNLPDGPPCDCGEPASYTIPEPELLLGNN